MQPRNIPPEIVSRLSVWRNRFYLGWAPFYLFWVVGVVSAILAATQPPFLPATPLVPGIISASCISLEAVVRPLPRLARPYSKAWRILSGACNRYKFQEDFSFEQLQNAVDEGEKVIELAEI